MADLSRTAAVLLAAGQSRRHPGASKLLRELGGRPLALHAAATLSSLRPATMIAVLGPTTTTLADALTALGFRTAMNEAPQKGLSGSLALGISAARSADIDAVLLCLADMPFVTPQHLGALAATVDPATGITRIGSRHPVSGVIMPPAAFAETELDALTALSGDKGARELLENAPYIEATIRDLTDFDNPEDFDAEA